MTAATTTLPGSLGQRLLALRGERGWTQQQLADASGVPQQTISRLERAYSRRGYPETILALAEALGVQPRDLLPKEAKP